jgi:hypothetical protein
MNYTFIKMMAVPERRLFTQVLIQTKRARAGVLKRAGNFLPFVEHEPQT